MKCTSPILLLVFSVSVISAIQVISQDPIRVAIAGDSSSQGFCNPQAHWFLIPSWPSQLRAKLNSLGENRYIVENYSKGKTSILKPQDPNDTINTYNLSSEEIKQVKEQSYLLRPEYTELIKSHQDIVFIMFGKNQIQIGWPSKFADDYLEFAQNIQKMKSKPDIFIVISPEDSMNENELFKRSLKQNSPLKYGSVLFNIASILGLDDNHIIYLDKEFGGEDVFKNQWSCDTLHLNQKGNEFLAQQAVNRLQTSKYVPQNAHTDNITADNCDHLHYDEGIYDAEKECLDQKPKSLKENYKRRNQSIY